MLSELVSVHIILISHLRTSPLLQVMHIALLGAVSFYRFVLYCFVMLLKNNVLLIN